MASVPRDDNRVPGLLVKGDTTGGELPVEGNESTGAMFVEGQGGCFHPNDKELAGVTNHVKKYYTYSGAVTDGIVWSPASGKRWYVTDLIVNVSDATTVTFEDDLTAGDSVVLKLDLAANSGLSHTFNTPLYSGEDAADLIVTTSAGDIFITITGYET